MDIKTQVLIISQVCSKPHPELCHLQNPLYLSPRLGFLLSDQLLYKQNCSTPNHTFCAQGRMLQSQKFVCKEILSSCCPCPECFIPCPYIQGIFWSKCSRRKGDLGELKFGKHRLHFSGTSLGTISSTISFKPL